MLKPFHRYLIFCLLNLAVSAYGQSYLEGVIPALPQLSPPERADTILSVPYDEMVNNLDLSRKMFLYAFDNAFFGRNDSLRGKAAHELCRVYYLSGRYDSAAFYNQLAQDIFERAGLKRELGDVLATYGYIQKRRNLPEAFRMMRRGIVMLESERAEDMLAPAYDNYGVLHEMNQNLDSAEYFYLRSLAIKKNYHDSIGIPYSLDKLAGACLIRKDYECSLDYLRESYKIREMTDQRMGLTESSSLLGDVYKEMTRFSEAITWYERSNALSIEIGYPAIRQYNFDQMAACYLSWNKPAQAFVYLERSTTLKDSLLNEKSLEQVNMFEQLYKAAEKDKSIAQLEEKNAKRMQLIFLIASALLITMLGGLLFVQIQRRRSQARHDEAVIREREKGLEAVVSATENERRRIAKDLHDGVSQQLSGLRLSFESLSSEIKTIAPQSALRLETLTTVLDEACDDVRSISHRMMPKALSEMGLLAAIEDMLRKSLGLSSMRYRLEHFKVEGRRFDERIEVGLFRVSQELVNNIIRHSGATEVVIQLYLSKNNLVLVVEDNGRGFTTDSSKEGLGLANITSRIHLVDGEVTWEPGPQQGTVATVRIPIQ